MIALHCSAVDFDHGDETRIPRGKDVPWLKEPTNQVSGAETFEKTSPLIENCFSEVLATCHFGRNLNECSWNFQAPLLQELYSKNRKPVFLLGTGKSQKIDLAILEHSFGLESTSLNSVFRFFSVLAASFCSVRVARRRLA